MQKLMRPPVSRTAVIAFVVVALHAGFIWALQSGMLMRAAELLVPAEILVEFVDPPAPKAAPARPAPPPPVLAPPKKAVAKAPVAQQPQPLAVIDTTPSPNAPAGVITPPAQTAAVVETSTAPLAPLTPAARPAPAVVQMPSSDADYLRNPKPPYPALSRRLGEQGLVVHSVLIGVDGAAVSARLVKSSGFERLDQAAYQAIMRWRYTPGKRNGVPEAMTFNVPFNWVLE
ncbi:energy transducer TonB [Polaromonas sp.]|uniref:energy transducer TonB n=1 Tax=Polaromonas sp. TaxID=1869339 RepID=UPI001DC607F8|nr:energy transducer TonB [Polaromonas sp.]MBT9474352.1 energy transducer TonB [Polaromonas sp.]